MLQWTQSAAFSNVQLKAMSIADEWIKTHPRSWVREIEKMPVNARIDKDGMHLSSKMQWPLPNVWLGTSVENQATADERIPFLLQTPAAVRWISAEPLLGPLDISRYMWPVHWHWQAGYATPEAALAGGAYAEQKPQGLVSASATFLNWVVVGGESGKNARPMELHWARFLRDQCLPAGTSFHFKQTGGRRSHNDVPIPEDLQIREYPK
jgi:protein gp37